MADRGHIKLIIIYLLSYLHGQLVTPLCCNDANVNHCSKNNFFTQRLHAVMIFGNQSRKLLLFTYGRWPSLDLTICIFLSHCLRDYGNLYSHITKCFRKLNNSHRERVQYHCNPLMTSFSICHSKWLMFEVVQQKLMYIIVCKMHI